MPSIQTEIHIDASASGVWADLMEFESYGDWNPLVQYNGGDPQVGMRLDLKIKQLSGSSFAVKPVVTKRVENRKFQWLGKLFVRGIFDGRHTFEIEEREGGVVLKHYENFDVPNGLVRRLQEDGARF